MRKPSPGITPEGIPAIALCVLAALIFAILGCVVLTLAFLLLTLFSVNFFRDPERVVPHRPGIAVSPADGKVIRVAYMPDPFAGKPRQCISVFMNVFSVHVNRSPVQAKVADIAYYEGRYFNAALDKASLENERCAYSLEDADGKLWTMVQIAGLVARRIVCRVEVGDSLARGERYGMIKFGSRVDLYLPDGYVPTVGVGQKVLAGQSVLAAKEEANKA